MGIRGTDRVIKDMRIRTEARMLSNLGPERTPCTSLPVRFLLARPVWLIPGVERSGCRGCKQLFRGKVSSCIGAGSK
jgi:hypothetical protein